MNCVWEIMQDCLHVFNCHHGNDVAVSKDTAVSEDVAVAATVSGKKIMFFVFLLILLVLPSCKEQPANETNSKPALVYGKIPPGQKKIIKVLKKSKTALNKPVKNLVNKPLSESVNKPLKKSVNKQIDKKVKLSATDKEQTDVRSMEKRALPEPDKEEEFYTSKGKVDPFAPLIRNDHKKADLKSGFKAKPSRVLTPLEKFDFSQIKLVAVIMAASGNIAMVEDSTRKGYTIRVGTYIGKNGGKVVKIEKDRVIVMEHVKNYKGESVIQSHVLKLNKPDNEG